MSADGQRPWVAWYPEGDVELDTSGTTLMDHFDATVARHPGRIAVRYFEGAITYGELDTMADALAAHLRSAGLGPGSTVALLLQNNPAFLVAMVAAWRLGAVAAPLSPLATSPELSHLLDECGADAVVILDELIHLHGSRVSRLRDLPVIVTSQSDFGDASVAAFGAEDAATSFARIVAAPADRVRVTVDPQAPAVFVPTSGTTGMSKFTVNSHANLEFGASVYRQWARLRDGAVVLGLSPIFHVTGLIGHVALTLRIGGTLVLTHRVRPELIIEAIRRHRPEFTIAVITAYIGLADLPDVSAEDFASFRELWSGGAPIEPGVAERLGKRFGRPIHNVYGLTEATSAVAAVPRGLRTPVDEDTRTLSIGIPVHHTTVRIVGEDGAELPAGAVGEIVVSGPQVAAGYLDKPISTAEVFGGGRLRTGDVGFMDPDGWFYVIDRSKDMISASGFKVWPREIEAALMTHPHVREAAVVAIPDQYRGQSPKAYVVLEPDASVSEYELIEFSRSILAPTKYPREVEFVAELPRTATGKIRRSALG
ncbi:class I adenylate-forming enzyme family protein [Aeromicrobium choanae]|uniref:Long-chain acyl-CoA synthetase n=1 Tax=Aeromicrobium choanae TaxID=1736691 RepID=A0A1T4YQ17_9ACTN|nr:AMP-binding protein [Aeromicrobium choanae]SKB03927.1 long-chain acyl-CoA synthetase [Aeromicrobium choanae]